MPVSPEGKKGMLYWGVIERAVEQKATTQELWNAIRETATREGLDRPGVSLQAVNELRSMVAQIRNADDALNRADRDTALQSEYFSTAPWSREQGERNLNPKLQIRFEHHTIVDGQLVTEWRTVVHTGRLPNSVGDLMSMVDEAADMLAQSYEVENAGVGRVSALSV